MIIKPVIGGEYKWKGQSNKLVYLGYNFDGGWWHQFALSSKPDAIWCETTGKELELLEKY
jgi:hypothetical protein